MLSRPFFVVISSLFRFALDSVAAVDANFSAFPFIRFDEVYFEANPGFSFTSYSSAPHFDPIVSPFFLDALWERI